jgi:hypothetical protein
MEYLRDAMKKTKVHWLEKPAKHDYPAALAYLNLILKPRAAQKAVNKLKRTKMTTFAAKDIFRASEVPLLGSGDSHVEKYRSQILRSQPISPVLLCRNPRLGKLIIADGYHRLCAVYTFDEAADIPCKII